MWIVNWGRPAHWRSELRSGDEDQSLLVFLCGHGSVIGDQCFGVMVWKSAFPPASRRSFSRSLGCVLCRAAGQRCCCFMPSGCFLYPLCSRHTLLQDETDVAAQFFVTLLSSRSQSCCYSLWFFQEQPSDKHTHVKSIIISLRRIGLSTRDSCASVFYDLGLLKFVQ